MLKSCRLFAILLTFLVATPAFAADFWVAADVRGSVFALIGGEWAELRDGDTIASGTAVRTLQTGQMTMVHGEAALEIGANSAVRSTDSGNGGVAIEQFSGRLTVAGGGIVYKLIMPNLTAVASDAGFTAQITNAGSAIWVRNGKVEVSLKGKHELLSAGQTISVGSTGVAVTAAGDASPVGSPSTGTTVTDTETGVLSKTDNGVGNGGVPGNGGKNPNSGSNRSGKGR